MVEDFTKGSHKVFCLGIIDRSHFNFVSEIILELEIIVLAFLFDLTTSGIHYSSQSVTQIYASEKVTAYVYGDPFLGT